MKIEYFHVSETDSTFLEIARVEDCLRQKGAVLPDYIVVDADFQTAGRGQKGNSWESERGRNLMFSIAFRPVGVEVTRQFRLSQAMALAVCETLNNIMEGFRIKWPNDVYYGEQKVCGMLFETTWRGREVDHCVVGVGVNVNQAEFRSDAPNPVSLLTLTGKTYDCNKLLIDIIKRFADALQTLYTGGDEQIAMRYQELMIWRDGLHTYRDGNGQFLACMEGVEADGHLRLRDAGGALRRYMFKEVKHIFNTLECE